VEEPRYLLFRLLTLERDGPRALAVRVEGRIGQRPGPDPRAGPRSRGISAFERIETPPALADGRIDAGPPSSAAVRWARAQAAGGRAPLRRAGRLGAGAAAVSGGGAACRGHTASAA
jgi:hypothetical protein